MTTTRLHYFSGLLLAVFIGLHLGNHLYSIAGPEKHIEVMQSLRLLYRHPVVESVLLLAVLVQIASGVSLFRRKQKETTSRFEQLHRFTGLYLAAFFVIHVGSVLIGRTVLRLDTNFYYGVAGLNTFPFNLFFLPYYGLATLSFFGHTAAIHHKKMKKTVFGWTPQTQALTILVIGSILTVGMLFGLTNCFQGVEIPTAYKVLVGQ